MNLGKTLHVILLRLYVSILFLSVVYFCTAYIFNHVHVFFYNQKKVHFHSKKKLKDYNRGKQ